MIEVDQLRDVLPAVAERLRVWVANASESDVELIARALDLQVWASHEAVRIEGSVPVAQAQAENLVTIGQASGCMFCHSVGGNAEGLGFSDILCSTLSPLRRHELGPRGLSLTALE